MYLFFLEYARELRIIAFIEEKRAQHTHNTTQHTRDSDIEDDTTPALMNQQGPIVHEQDPFLWPGMSRCEGPEKATRWG
jgi:hypothetical protein